MINNEMFSGQLRGLHHDGDPVEWDPEGWINLYPPTLSDPAPEPKSQSGEEVDENGHTRR